MKRQANQVVMQEENENAHPPKIKRKSNEIVSATDANAEDKDSKEETLDKERWKQETRYIEGEGELGRERKPSYVKLREQAQVADDWIYDHLLRPHECRLVFADGSCKPSRGYGGSAACIIHSQPISVGMANGQLPDREDVNLQPVRAQAMLEMNDFKKTDKSQSILGLTTNNIAELTAVNLALDLIEAEQKRLSYIREFWILTDSRYSIGVLTGQNQAVKNKELIQSIRERMRDFITRLGIRLDFQWVPGHASVRYNEHVDSLAKKAAHFAYQASRQQ